MPQRVFMDRYTQRQHNNSIIHLIKPVVTTNRLRPPSYKFVCEYLNILGVTTSRGNYWTEKRLFRMLQRMGYSGLHGLYHKQSASPKNNKSRVSSL